jgi:DNA-binding protein HU-beta
VNKQQLISQVANKSRISKSQALRITDSILNTIEGALKKGEKVQLVGFGSWNKRRRKARTGRNPQTGVPISIPAKNVVSFTPGSFLLDLIN